MGRRFSERWRNARTAGCLGREGWPQIAAIYFQLMFISSIGDVLSRSSNGFNPIITVSALPGRRTPVICFHEIGYICPGC